MKRFIVIENTITGDIDQYESVTKFNGKTFWFPTFNGEMRTYNLQEGDVVIINEEDIG